MINPEPARLSEKRQRLAAMIDHTLLKPEATTANIERLCEEAICYRFASVCVNPAMLPAAVVLLEGSPVIPCTVIGFPLGATSTATKAFEADHAASCGAREIDMVMAIWAIKQHAHTPALSDMKAVVAAAGPQCGVKVILEACLLTDDEKTTACRLAMEAGAKFVKTSTGFNTGGATQHDIALMRATVGPLMGVKASGGIRTLADAETMIAAGASRLGTSAGIAIVTAP